MVKIGGKMKTGRCANCNNKNDEREEKKWLICHNIIFEN